MGFLSLAGVISGAGKGLQQGLSDAQRTFSSHYLETERAKMEELRQSRLFKHEAAQTDRKIAADERLADKNIGANKALQEERLGHDIVSDSIKEQNTSTRHREQQTTARKELDVRLRQEDRAKSYYDAREAALKRMEAREANRLKAGGAKTDGIDKAIVHEGFKAITKLLENPSERTDDFVNDIMQTLRNRGALESAEKKTDEIKAPWVSPRHKQAEPPKKKPTASVGPPARAGIMDSVTLPNQR